MAKRVKQQRRLGRPPAEESVETRARIIDAARGCFARYGYDKTTNQLIARKAGITSGAIYHYFESKQDLFGAVALETQDKVITRLRAALTEGQSFAEQIDALLDAATQLQAEDPSMAGFVSSSPMEVRRHEEFVKLAQEQRSATLQFFRELVDQGQRRGEIAADVDPDAVARMLLATTSGIALHAAFIETFDEYLGTVDAFKRLIAGTLVIRAPGGA